MEVLIELFKTDKFFRNVCLFCIVVFLVFLGSVVQWFCGVKTTALILKENAKTGVGTKVVIRTPLFSVSYDPVFPPASHTSNSSGTGRGSSDQGKRGSPGSEEDPPQNSST